MNKLTASQARVFELIKRLIAETGLPPTRAEIARKLGFKSANAAQEHLRLLAHKGLIELRTGSARGIRLRDCEGLPVIARVAAGSPVLAEAHVEDRYQLDPHLFAPGADYLLRVQGMSMREAGIFDEDLLAVHRTSEVRDGQIVVARIDDEVTVKRYSRSGNEVRLMPENPEFEPIIVNLKNETLVIEGIVVGVIRNGRAL